MQSAHSSKHPGGLVEELSILGGTMECFVEREVSRSLKDSFKSNLRFGTG